MTMRPQRQRDAEEMFNMARALVEARGDELGILRLTESLIITSDVPLLGKSPEANTLVISIEGRIVLRAIYGDDDSLPPFFVEFFPDAGWRWTIRRAHAAMEMESCNAHVA